MIKLPHRIACAVSALAILALPACVASQSVEPVIAPVSAPAGPAMWKVADEDTTIYLFGTVHALPGDVEWMRTDISAALAASDTLVTEILPDEMNSPSSQMMIASKAMLPPDQSLRAMLSEDDRSAYEAALGSLGMPPGTFDRFEPWFAGVTLAVLPLMKEGYNPESGVEKIIDTEAGSEKSRAALETLEQQMSLFDDLPREAQVEFLMSSVRDPLAIVNMMDQMVAEWMDGDADALAALMNQGLSNPTLAAALLYDRNARWAEWIDTRMDEPGEVFIAVGAGHLAGDKSVQDYLESRGISVSRIR